MEWELPWTVCRWGSQKCVYIHIYMVLGSLLQGERLLCTCASANDSGPVPVDCLDSFFFFFWMMWCALSEVRNEEREIFCYLLNILNRHVSKHVFSNFLFDKTVIISNIYKMLYMYYTFVIKEIRNINGFLLVKLMLIM